MVLLQVCQRGQCSLGDGNGFVSVKEMPPCCITGMFQHLWGSEVAVPVFA